LLVLVPSTTALAEGEASAAGADVASTVRLRITGSPSYAQGREVAVREALLIDTISVFIGKSGAVRLRGGTTAAIVILSSQELGCGRVQDAVPAVQVLGAQRAAEFAKRLESTRPQVADPHRRFESRGDEDFEVSVTAALGFDPKEMDENPGASPSFLFELLEGRIEDWSTGDELEDADAPLLHLSEGVSLRRGSLIFPAFTLSLLHEKAVPTGELAKVGRKTGVDLSGVAILQLENRSFRQAAAKGRSLAPGAPWFEIQRRGGELRVKLDVEEPSLTLHADVPLRKCPAVEHIHIEPKK
jgi:hypothetical protein